MTVEAMILKLAGGMALFAEAPAPEGKEAPPPDLLTALFGSPLILFAMLFLVFYFIMIRPQKREQAQRRAMLAGVKKNDRIVTIGGIYGIVTNVQRETDEVTIRVDETTNTKMRVTISAIARILGDAPSEETANK
jgi:preprotein translocase subunit YajC